MSEFEFNFSKKNILIVGGSSGIGYEAAVLFSKLGGNVTVTCKKNKSFEEFKIKNENEKISIEKLDLTNDIAVEGLAEKINSLDILINCASLVKGGVEYRIENFSDIVNVNLMGTLRICHSMLPKLALTRGNIINLTSVNTKLAGSTSPAYASTKSGIESLTKSMAACWASHNVRVNNISPGWIEGNTYETLVKDLSELNYDERIPLKRLGKPKEVANVILFLASEYASYITGATILVDGGFSIN